MLKYPYVLFDLDGTLIDTNEIIIDSYHHTLKNYVPNETFSDQQIIDFIGPPLEVIFERYVSKSIAKEMIDYYRTYYRAHEESKHRLYPGVKENLEELKKLGVKMAIVTSKYKAGAMPSVRYYGLESYFDAFIGLDDVTHPKPHAEPVLKALRLLGAEKDASALMIGDNQGDILAGFNAGIEGVGVAWAIKGETHLSAVNPSYLIHDMSELIDIVQGG